jgi:hypothetical protein
VSVKQNLVTDRAPENFERGFKNTHARGLGNGNCARGGIARAAMSGAEAGSSSTTHQQHVDESLGISESEFSFGRNASLKFFIVRWVLEVPAAQGFPGPSGSIERKSLLRRKNSCSISEGSYREKHALP